MKRNERAGHLANEIALDWTLRIVGLLVFVASIFFVYRPLTLSPAYDYFFAATALLGLVTVAASWLRAPEPEGLPAHAHQKLEVVRQRSR